MQSNHLVKSMNVSSKKSCLLLAGICFLLLGIFLLSLCSPETEAREKSSFSVLTSIFPLFEFAQAVAGAQGRVDLLLPPGASPHTWQPRASDIIKVQEADVFIFIGPSLEPWIEDLLRARKDSRIMLLSLENLSFLQDEDEPRMRDPHIWLDFNLDVQIVRQLAAAFSRIAPASASEFERNAAAYIARLQELDSLYQKTLNSCDQRVIVVDGHGAFSYLARRYGLRQISLYGLNPEAEPTPGQLRHVLELAKKEKISAIFFEAGTNPRFARLLSRELRIKILPLYAGHNLSPEERRRGISFIDLMTVNLKNLKEGLNCE